MATEVTRAEGALERGARLIDEARRELDQACRDLAKELQGSENLWAGAGGSAFRQVYQQWDQEIVKVVSTLGELEGNLRKSEADYAATDERAASRLTRLQGRLG